MTLNNEDIKNNKEKKSNNQLPAYLKKKEDKIPCAALLHIKSMVAFEWPCMISKLVGPKSIEIQTYKQKNQTVTHKYGQ